MRGIGSMLHELSGGSPNSASKYAGRKITAASFGGDAIHLTFEDGVSIKLFDDGQSCCEERYMTCEDDPSRLVGQILKDIKVKEVTEDDKENYDTHEIAFLEIQTDKDVLSFSTHNKHNGYYGGFGLSIKEVS